MLQKPLDSVAEPSIAASRSMRSERPVPSGLRKSRLKLPTINFDQRVFLRALLVWLPTFIVMAVLLWQGDYSNQTRWTAVVLLSLAALVTAGSLQSLILRPLQTLSNLLSAIREEDFSFK